MLICKYCNKECKNPNSHRNHERLCPKNISRVYKNGMLGKVSWCKGLTKETDPRIALAGEKISKALKGKPSRTIWTEEMRKNKSEWRKKLHAENPNTHPNRKLAGNRLKMSYPEQVAYDWLVANNISFVSQDRIGKYYPDFIVGKIIIEIDGERWHTPEKDKIKDKFFNDQGYVVYRIKSKEKIHERLSTIFQNI